MTALTSWPWRRTPAGERPQGVSVRTDGGDLDGSSGLVEHMHIKPLGATGPIRRTTLHGASRCWLLSPDPPMSGRWRLGDGPEQMIDSVSARDRTLTWANAGRRAVGLAS